MIISSEIPILNSAKERKSTEHTSLNKVIQGLVDVEICGVDIIKPYKRSADSGSETPIILSLVTSAARDS
jgi:hypothetical protein